MGIEKNRSAIEVAAYAFGIIIYTAGFLALGYVEGQKQTKATIKTEYENKVRIYQYHLDSLINDIRQLSDADSLAREKLYERERAWFREYLK